MSEEACDGRGVVYAHGAWPRLVGARVGVRVGVGVRVRARVGVRVRVRVRGAPERLQQ